MVMVMVMVMVMMADFYISLATAPDHLRLEVASSVAVRNGVLSPSPPSIFPRKYNSMWILAMFASYQDHQVQSFPGPTTTGSSHRVFAQPSHTSLWIWKSARLPCLLLIRPFLPKQCCSYETLDNSGDDTRRTTGRIIPSRFPPL